VVDQQTGPTPVPRAPRSEALPDFGRPELAALRGMTDHPVLADVVGVLESRAAHGGPAVAYYDDAPGRLAPQT
jgi:hypothetical protein